MVGGVVHGRLEFIRVEALCRQMSHLATLITVITLIALQQHMFQVFFNKDFEAHSVVLNDNKVLESPNIIYLITP